MIRSIRVAVTKVSNGEKLYSVVTGVEGLARRITEIWGESGADEIVRGYIDTDRIVDVHGDTDQIALLPIPVNHLLTVGQEFKVGILDEAGNTNVVDLTVFYEET